VATDDGARYEEDHVVVAGTRTSVRACPIPVELDLAAFLPD